MYVWFDALTNYFRCLGGRRVRRAGWGFPEILERRGNGASRRKRPSAFSIAYVAGDALSAQIKNTDKVFYHGFIRFRRTANEQESRECD